VITEFELRGCDTISRACERAPCSPHSGCCLREVFSRSGAMHTGNIPYLDFIAPGILAQSVLS